MMHGRCDMGVALLNVSSPIFFMQPTEPIPDYPTVVIDAASEAGYVDMPPGLSSPLRTAWAAMKRFCLLVNLSSRTQRRIQPDLIHGTMVPVIYHLLHMKFEFGATNEAVRMGLLTFSHYAFLQWQDVKPAQSNFSKAYKRMLLDGQSLQKLSSRLMLWLLMTGAASLFNVPDEAWLVQCLRDSASTGGISSWRDLEEVLKFFLWIQLSDEDPGEYIFDLMSRDSG